jgi:UDP-glucose 4-epimerase
MESVLVTGGAGFIGSNITEELLTQGKQVVVLDDLSSGKMENIEHHLSNKAFSFYRGSILDSGLVKSILRKHSISHISHQAAIASVTKSIQNPVMTSNVNILGTITIFDLAAEYGCKRIVFASSSSIYGDARSLPIKETVPLNSKSPYAASKAANEIFGGVFQGLYGLQIIGLRYFNVFGRRQDPASDYAAVIPLFIAKALKNEAIPIEGDGMQTRDFIYINDVVQANIKALTHDAIKDSAFNIACGERTSIRDLAHMIVDITGSKSEIVHLPPRTGDVRDSHADIGNAKKHMSFEPEFTIQEGLRETISWYRDRTPCKENCRNEQISSTTSGYQTF